MKRNKLNPSPTSVKCPDLILTSDWHLREDTPVCRVDDFQISQWNKVSQVAFLQKRFGCPVVHAGDLFHHWKPSPNLISNTLKNLPESFYTVYGQHDLPEHSMDLKHKSGIYAIASAHRLREVPGSWGDESPGEFKFSRSNMLTHRVALWHKFVWDGEKLPWPGCDEKTAKQVLRENPEFDLIVTGDHHRPFTYEYKGRLLVNCGCLTRQEASYQKHRPRVWLWYDLDNRVVPYYLPVEIADVSREHLELAEIKEKRISAFISRLADDWEVGISFEDNLKKFISSNKIRKPVVELIYKSIE